MRRIRYGWTSSGYVEPVWVEVAVLVPDEPDEPEAVMVLVPVTAVLRCDSVAVVVELDDSVSV